MFNTGSLIISLLVLTWMLKDAMELFKILTKIHQYINGDRRVS